MLGASRSVGHLRTVGVVALVLTLVGAGTWALVGTGPGALVGAPSPAPASQPERDLLNGTTFRESAAEHGLRYTFAADRIENGGVYALDYDRDGWTDLLAVGGHGVTLFHNRNGTFEPSGQLPNVTAASALVFDYDADGWSDVLLLRRGDEPLLLANRRGRFERRSAGFEDDLAYPLGATAADFEGDGCLDVFVAQYRSWDDRIPAAARYDVSNVSLTADNGRPNRLYDGNCSEFENATAAAGVRGSAWSVATSAVDFTGDGRPDIHVANDFNEDVLYVNRGDGTFEHRTLGPATDRNGMSSEVADFTGDGRPDVFVTNVYLPQRYVDAIPVFEGRASGNNLLVNRGNGSFEDRASAFGVRRGGWGWAVSYTDFDNDGDRDLFHSTNVPKLPGRVQLDVDNLTRYRRQRRYLGLPSFWERTERGFEHRRGARLGFELATGTGVATLDVDNDGDRDLAVAQTSGPLLLYENTADERAGAAVEFALGGAPRYGTTVHVTVDGRTQSRTLTSRSDFLSQDSRVLHFGVGDRDAVNRVRIVWPDGSERVLTDLPTDVRYRVAANGSVRRLVSL
ncbi:MAG: CRTAC1 family protein [Haloferacaceae archaeon]